MLSASTIATAFTRPVQHSNQLDETSKKLQSGSKMTPEAAKKVSDEFESMFVSEMLDHMMAGDSLGESAFGNADTDEIYKGMMVDQYAKSIVKAGGIGIAQYIENSLNQRGLLQAQEVH